MLFTSVTFIWFFLPAVLAVNFVLSNKYRNCFLFFASCVFYAWGGPKQLVLMLLSITLNYLFGLAIAGLRSKKLWLTLGVIANIGILGYFKYFNMLLELLSGAFKLNISSAYYVALPIGISFYTFQALSYLIDLYRGRFEVQRSLMKFGLYISLFPQLIAGPIVQYKDIAQDIDTRTITTGDLSYGIKRFIYGFGKKMIFSNGFALVVDTIFSYKASDITFAGAWLGAISYGLQIYYDFSGYSDMAIGLGRMLGFKFLENFNYPYISSSITEFWRRWHISLSSWFKEYLYIPLGGNRKGRLRTLINLFIVFILTGFWHGAASQFIAWGVYFGIFLVLEKLLWKEPGAHLPSKLAAHLYTLAVVTFSWVIFRSPNLSYAYDYSKNMLAPWLAGQACTLTRFMDARTVVLFLFGFLLCGPLQQAVKPLKKALFDTEKTGFPQIVLLTLIFVYSLILLVSNTYNPFIYFRF